MFPIRILYAALLAGTGLVVTGSAAAAPDWSKAASRTITVVYPGVSPIEWIRKGVDHSGARGMKQGETCVNCHEKEAVDFGQRMATGQKIEPEPIKGKVGSIPVKVEATHDGTNIYLRFTWKQPPGGGPKMDPDNDVKLAFMLDAGKVELAHLGGCWSSCHNDVRTMPGVKGDKTKYVKDGSLASGVFYDLIQWQSKSNKGRDGYIADKRVMEGGKGLVDAKGEKKGDTWTVTFTRKLSPNGEGDINLESGKSYNFGFAIHDDHTHGRFHHVSFGYKLGIDADGDLKVTKQ
ncbi:ethylbenzene dehydrogenase-related protein [Sulfuricystis thermophila]|uniref:ethylbenzene dehydrogenase-related protein n=1 Tax=Sulfuricystis thermophila TaxID=2496847 RepID=UPI001036A4D9|nr:ethylbenzene dehydrogenase-related protein [Sulfuricystis thermophila]